MKIVVKKVGMHPRVVEVDALSLEDMQELVGGLIECVHVSPTVDLWCNDEGKLLDLPLNMIMVDGERAFALDTINGDIFFASADEDGNTVGLTDDDVEWVLSQMSVWTMLIDDEDENKSTLAPLWYV